MAIKTKESKVAKENMKKELKLTEKREKTGIEWETSDGKDKDNDKWHECQGIQEDNNNNYNGTNEGFGSGVNYIKILMIKIHKIQDREEYQEIKDKIAQFVEELVNKQIMRNNITGVQDQDAGETTVELKDYKKQISMIKITGTNILRVEIFF